MTAPANQPLPSARTMWIPLVAVTVILAALVTAPIIVRLRARRLRTAITEVIDPARFHASRLGTSLAEEMLAVRLTPRPSDSVEQARYGAAAAAERRDVLALDSLVRDLGPDGIERLSVYRETSGRWHADADSLWRHRAPRSADGIETDALAAIASVESLSGLFDRVAGIRRAQALRVERVDVWLPVALVPLGLVACALVIRAGQRTVALAAAAERDRRALAAAVEQKSTFIRGLTHDLQNPLGAALGHLSLIRDGIIRPEDERAALSRVSRLLNDVTGTVSSLLTVARSKTGELPVSTGSIDLAALVRGAMEDYQLMTDSRRQRVSIVGGNECLANGDAARVRHIIDNLLSNASKYTPEGGEIRFVVGRDRMNERQCAVTVEDSGPGIPSEWRERVFNEFERVPASRDTVPGTGIGLSVSRKVARMMDGDLTLEPAGERVGGQNPLGGAAFTLRLRSA